MLACSARGRAGHVGARRDRVRRRSGVPGPPSAYLGTVLDKPVPDSVADLPLTTDAGQATSLAALRGQVVVLADFLTLCQETCPLTTGNLLMMDRAVTAAGLARRVRFAELTVDPSRDTPCPAARLPDAGRGAGELVPAHRQPGRDRADLAVLRRLVSAGRRGQPARYGLADRQAADLRHHPPGRPDLPRRERGGSASWWWARPTPPGLPSRLPCAASSAPRAAPTSATPTRAPGRRPKRSARSPG